MTCKTHSWKAFIDFFCWHPIFWHRSSLIRSHMHGTELFFFLAADFPKFVLIFTGAFIFWAALQHICIFLCVCFSINICALLYTFIVLFASFLGHQYCTRAHHISLYRETIHVPSFCVSKLYCNFYKSRRTYFSKNIFLQSCFSQTNDSAVFEKVSKN